MAITQVIKTLGSVTASMRTALDSWLSQNISNPSNPPLDRSLSLANACAPADLVGDLINDISDDISDIVPIELSEDVSKPPTVLLGKYIVSLATDSKLYNGTINVASLLGLREGVYDVRGCTVTIEGNKVKLNGTVSNGSPSFSLTTGNISTTTELQTATLPLPDHRFTLSQKTISGTSAPPLCIRSKTSGNITTTQNNTAQFNFSSASCGDIYLAMSATTYNCEFIIALFPYNTSNANQFRETASIVTEISVNGKYNLDGYTWNSGSVDISEVRTKFPKKPKLRYSTREIAYSNMRECLDVYIPASKGYVNYILGRTQGTSSQAEGGGNVWRLVQVDAVGEAFDYKFHITQQGETEMALRIVGTDDFIGGTTHGDEWMIDNSLFFNVDGKTVDITTYTDITEFETLKVFLVSNLYHPADHSTLIGVHGREWMFNTDGLYLGQTVDFTETVTLTNSYMPMLCALRGNDTASALQVTDTYADDGSYQIYDVSEAGFTNYPNQLKNFVKDVNLFGENSKVSINLKIIEQPDTLKGRGVFLYNGINTYNKIYCTICGYGGGTPTQETIESGTKWKVKSQISIDIG